MAHATAVAMVILIVLNLWELKLLKEWLSELLRRLSDEAAGMAGMAGMAGKRSRWSFSFSALLRAETLVYISSIPFVRRKTAHWLFWVFVFFGILHTLGWGIHRWYRFFDNYETALQLPISTAFGLTAAVLVGTVVEFFLLFLVAAQGW